MEGSLCIDTYPEADGVLTWQKCNPRIHQNFNLTSDGVLVFTRTSQCVVAECIRGVITLKLADCATANLVRFQVGKYENLAIIKDQVVGLCIAAHGESDWALRGEVVVLAPDRSRCGMRLLGESWFRQDRAALLLPNQENSPCDFPACGINLVRRSPIQLLPNHLVEPCTDLSLCLTVIVKTLRRMKLVIRLVQSLRDVLGYNVNVVAVDDGPERYPVEEMEPLQMYPNLNYVFGDGELGIAAGRNLGLSHVNTKYVLVVDDDFVFRGRDFVKMVDVLDTTDVSFVGGSIHGETYPGSFEFMRGPNGERLLSHHSGTCNATYSQPLPNFPSCFGCEITLNFFMARTVDLMQTGGWSSELKVGEHKDAFIRFKAHGKKGAYCPEILVNHERPEATEDEKYQRYKFLRRKRMKNYSRAFANVWNIDLVIST